MQFGNPPARAAWNDWRRGAIVREEWHEIVPINDRGHYRDEAGLGGSSYKPNRRASTAFLVGG